MTSTDAPIRILIVDDEQIALERLRIYLSDIPGVQIVGDASDGDAALVEIDRLEPDAVILDIQMPGRSGMAVAREVLGRSDPPQVVFVTAFEQFAPDAFDVDAADYLLKPVRIDRLRHAVDRVRRRRRLLELALRGEALSPPAETSGVAATGLWVSGSQGRTRVSLEDIQWIEAAKDYVLIHTGPRTHIIRSTMGALESQLSGRSGMMRVHRSAFVRLGAVVGTVQPGTGALTLVLDGGAEVAVGPSYIGATAEALSLRR